MQEAPNPATNRDDIEMNGGKIPVDYDPRRGNAPEPQDTPNLLTANDPKFRKLVDWNSYRFRNRTMYDPPKIEERKLKWKKLVEGTMDDKIFDARNPIARITFLDTLSRPWTKTMHPKLRPYE